MTVRSASRKKHEQTLSELSMLLNKSTGNSGKHLLDGLDDIDSFERRIADLSKQIHKKHNGKSPPNGVDRAYSDYYESGSDGDDYIEEGEMCSADVMELGEEMEPQKELELLMAQVSGGDEDESQSGDNDDGFEGDSDGDDGGNESCDDVDEPGRKRQIPLSDDESDEDVLDAVKQVLSSYEVKKRKLAREISALEEENVAEERPWVLSGEVRGSQRPENSLLEEIVDFECATKTLPEITETVTESFEQIIKNRIREKAWDDPRVLTPQVVTNIPKQSNTLNDQSKERASLAQIYEDDALRSAGVNAEALNSKTVAAHATIKKLFGKIMRALDEMGSVN